MGSCPGRSFHILFTQIDLVLFGSVSINRQVGSRPLRPRTVIIVIIIVIIIIIIIIICFSSFSFLFLR